MWRVHKARRRVLAAAAGARWRAPWGVALTFDDGPSPEFTPEVLDVLRGLDVRATFFLLGEQVQAHPDLVLRMRAEGHGIGSHSRSHARFADLDVAGIAEEIEGGIVDLQLVLGRRTRLFRPPNGHVDRRVALAMRRARTDAWLWTVDSQDYEPGRSADEIVERCLGLRDRDVVLLHDGMAGVPEAADRTATIEALPRIVELVRARGLDFIAL